MARLFPRVKVTLDGGMGHKAKVVDLQSGAEIPFVSIDWHCKVGESPIATIRTFARAEVEGRGLVKILCPGCREELSEERHRAAAAMSGGTPYLPGDPAPEPDLPRPGFVLDPTDPAASDALCAYVVAAERLGMEADQLAETKAKVAEFLRWRSDHLDGKRPID